ncbi:hypothetical protein RQP46_003895 [Phenoliferia psychrophenolica]
MPSDTAAIASGIVPPAFSRIREIFAADPSSGRDANGAWEKMWVEGATPWDGAEIQPAFREIVEERWGEVEGVDFASLVDGGNGKALVPGCGRGYDVIYLASKGFQATGADLSVSAVAAAQAHYATLVGAPKNVNFQQMDFFKDLTPGAYSICYDYTFFCAIPPVMRKAWGESYAKGIRSGGVLITMMWPIVGDKEGGPPFSVSEEAYHEVLSPYFTPVYLKDPIKTADGHAGSDKVGVWKRK